MRSFKILEKKMICPFPIQERMGGPRILRCRENLGSRERCTEVKTRMLPTAGMAVRALFP